MREGAMSGLLILGAGGHGRVVADAALECGRWDRIAFLDDYAEVGATVLGLPVAGPFADLASQRARFDAAIVGIGDARRRLELLAHCRQAGFQLPSVVHPAASVSRFATLGEGTVVLGQAGINAGARLGAACIVNTGATVDHDCELGEGVHVSPGAHLAGTVHVGERSWVGIGSCVREGIRIGARVLIGAGAAVISDIPDDSVALGVPAIARGKTE